MSDNKVKLTFGDVKTEKDYSINIHSLSSDLRKSILPVQVSKEVRDQITPARVVFDSTQNSPTSSDNVEMKGWKRLSDQEQKELSQLDPYVSSIISTRCAQCSNISQPSDSKFDKGFRIKCRDEYQSAIDKLEPSERETRVSADQKEISAIKEWLKCCGSKDKTTLDSVFQNNDSEFKYCSLRDYIVSQGRNLLTFGRAGAQKFRDTESGGLLFFRPVPIESIMPVIDQGDIHVADNEDAHPESLSDAKDYDAIPEGMKPNIWVQRIDGQNVAVFEEDELSIWYYQKQAFLNLNGYPLSPLELCLYMVWIHQQTLNYLRNQFVKGLATKGALVLSYTQENVTLSDDDLTAIRQEFNNYVLRNDNSATIPMISGPVAVNWVPLMSSPKEMEFLQVEDHVIRALCSSFQISPQEMGYGHLSLNSGGLTQSNKQLDIVQGEERGLRMLLDIIFEGLNELLAEWNPEASKKYEIIYLGVGEDTRDAVVSRQSSELQTTATMNSLLADSDKNKQVPIGGDVPLSPTFHANVVKYLKYGAFLEAFFGIEGASKKPEYDFIIDPNLNQAYMSLKTNPVQLQQKAAVDQVQAQEMQMQAMQAQMQQPPPQQGAEGQPPAEGEPVQAQGGEEPAEKSSSLRDKYKKYSEPLSKSVESYFAAWLKNHDRTTR